MRDLVVLGVLFAFVPVALVRPYIGVLLWTWVSVMNPHRLAWGIAFDFPVAQVAAIATLIGLIFTKDERKFPVTPVTVTLILFILWMCLTSLFAIYPEESGEQFSKVMKIQLMILVALLVLHSRDHLTKLVWVLVVSVGFYGVKGGIFTITHGGENLVFGPPGGFFEDNNALALSQIIIIPLIFYLYRYSTKKWVRIGLLGTSVLCAAAALGTHSRGGLLAIAAMGGFLWLKSHRKALTLIPILLVGLSLVAFMPEKWAERMGTISEYQQDASAMGRINAWWQAYNLAKDRFMGGGFEVIMPELFERYAPNPTDLHAAHSIYFQILGEHGFVGLGVFLLLWFLVWRTAAWIVRTAPQVEELGWTVTLAKMVQVSLIGYLIGGTFLSLAYFDLPYNLLVLVVAARVLVEKHLASTLATRQPGHGLQPIAQ